MTKKLILPLILLTAFAIGNAQTYVQLILDASGSMFNELDDGRLRIDAAKDVISSFVNGLPDGDLNVGLRIYGSQSTALEEGACEDTQLFVPMEGLDKLALQETVLNTEAKGATPIAFSLLQAANDFPSQADTRLIILVTDGEEACGGNLNEVADTLRAQGFDIDLRIIGFDLTAEAVESFEGIGASFENAESAEELAEALNTAVEDVVEPNGAPLTTVESTFDGSDIDEWTINFGKLTNPGIGGSGDEANNGYIATTAPSEGETSYYIAPEKFHGNWQNASLSVTLFSSGGSHYIDIQTADKSDIFLANGDLTAQRLLPNRPDTEWENFSIPLTDDGNWIFSGGASSLDEILSNVTDFQIRAEYGEGADESALDNVTLIVKN